MKEGLIGVIVPVYKVEKYIAECIESILAQTYTNFRLILVNDGTPDNAGKICDEYAKKDSRITVIHQENAGVTRARARGVEEASDCEWITFVDSDDTITTEALHQLLKAMSNNEDIVISQVSGHKYPNAGSISKEEYLHYLISGQTLSCALWGKLFRRVLFSDNVLDLPQEIIHGEDLIMNIRLGFKTNNKIVILKNNIYNYNVNLYGCDRTFKKSANYESLFFEHLIKSIPSEELNTYYKDTIRKRIAILKDVVCYKYVPSKEWFGSDFHNKLINDIKIFNYQLQTLERITITYSNFLIRVLPVFVLKLLFFKRMMR